MRRRRTAALARGCSGVEIGDETAAVNLAALLREHDREDEAVTVLRAAAGAGGYEAGGAR